MYRKGCLMAAKETEKQIPASELTLEKAFTRLDELLEQLGNREVSLDESFQAYAEGTRLLKYCNDHLDQVEKRMQVLDEEGGLDEL